VKMYILAKDIDKAIIMKENMKNLGFIPDRVTYGMIIEAYTHRHMIVEALKQLEEASAYNHIIPERHLSVLRITCKNLGVQHPNMPDDPNQWIKDAKKIRKDRKQASNRPIQFLQSKMFS
jgi:hypothetical protein